MELINYIPLSNAVIAGRTAWQSFHKGGIYEKPTDNITEDDFIFLDRLFNKYKHISVAEHIWYTFRIPKIYEKSMLKIKNEYNFFSIEDDNFVFSVNLRTIFEELNSSYIGNEEIKIFYNELVEHLPASHKNLIKQKGYEESSFSPFMCAFMCDRKKEENEEGHKVELLYNYKVSSFGTFERRPHSFYTIRLSGFSRALLQELVRHDDLLAITAKSTRYTLKELKDESHFRSFSVYDEERAKKYLYPLNNIFKEQIKELEILREELEKGTSNDITKYLLPESYRSEVILTLNENNLKNLLKLRLDKSALLEFQKLSKLIEKIIK